MLKRKLIGVLTGLLLCVASMQAQQHWQCNVHDFQYDMTVYAALQLNGQGVAASEAYEVAAFCGEECRGIATAESIPGTDSTYYYLRIRSNVIAGDSITFKYYDPSTDEEIELNESLTFVSQSIAGFPSSPFTLTGEANVHHDSKHNLRYLKKMRKNLNLIAALFFLTGGALQTFAQEAVLTIEDFKIMPGEKKVIEVCMTNSLPIRGFEMKPVLPEGITMAGSPAAVEDRIGTGTNSFGEVVTSSKKPNYSPVNGKITFASGDDAIPFSGTEGPVMTLTIKAADDLELGYATITLEEVELVNYDETTGVTTMIHPEIQTTNVKVYNNFDITSGETAGGTVDGTGTYEWDTEASMTATPYEGYSFEKWSDETTENPYVFTVTESKEITPVFKANTYRIVYTLDGEELQADSVVYGDAIVAPEAPAREGYTFAGWTNLPETMPAGDLIVEGIYTVNKYNIIYIVDGEEYKRTEVDYGAEIPVEAAPEKEGHTFSGWSEVPATMPAGDVTVTGTFTVNTYTITYYLDGEEYATADVTYGSAIEPIADPEKEGYTFSGWEGLPETMPAHDVEIHGTMLIDTGLEAIMADSEDGLASVYTLQGILVKENIPIENLEEELPRGIYLINGHKVMIP